MRALSMVPGSVKSLLIDQQLVLKKHGMTNSAFYPVLFLLSTYYTPYFT